MITRRLLLSAVAPVFVPFAAFADDEKPEPKPRVFEKMFPRPTGTNGFEEIIRAAELADGIADEYHGRVNGGVPLAQKRAYLAHPVCREAASLLRRGLAKPITIPGQDPFSEDIFQPHALLRTLARLLSDEIYVAMADGRTDVAVRTAAEGLILAHPLKSVSVISGLVARAMEAIVLAPLVRQRDAWTVRDCQYLIRLAQQRLALPDPAPIALGAERATTLRMIERWRNDPDQWCDAIEKQYAPYEEGEPEPPELHQARDIAQSLRADATLRERIFREMTDAVRYHFDRANDLLKDPTGRMVLAPGANPGEHAMMPFLRETFLLEALGTVQRSIESRVNLQLLAVHAAIRRHRWEAERLPKSLEELPLAANIVTDPFTRKPLLYEPDESGTGYELASAGALYPGENGKPDARERITLPWTQPK